jgi:hypothetical protein
VIAKSAAQSHAAAEHAEFQSREPCDVEVRNLQGILTLNATPFPLDPPKGVPAGQGLLCEYRLRLHVADIAGWRADQFGDFVMFLKFSAIHFDEGVWIFPKSASASTSITYVLPDPVGARNSRFPTGRRRHAHKKCLVELENRVHGGVLPNDSSAQERPDSLVTSP